MDKTKKHEAALHINPKSSQWRKEIFLTRYTGEYSRYVCPDIEIFTLLRVG